jgi:hypothetical protein
MAIVQPEPIYPAAGGNLPPASAFSRKRRAIQFWSHSVSSAGAEQMQLENVAAALRRQAVSKMVLNATRQKGLIVFEAVKN